MRQQARRLLSIPALRGNLHVTVGNNTPGAANDAPELVVLGDPEGLRSLAEVLIALADVDQKRLLDLAPNDAHEHLHLDPVKHLGENSARLIISRLDDQRGALPYFYGKRLRKRRPIREARLMKNV